MIYSINSDTVTRSNTVENQVGIDVKNIDFLATLLTSNLYSNPLGSFLRETVANAYDSHVEADTTDQPIILYIKDKEKIAGSHANCYKTSVVCDISIRDYGTGLSPERFDEIYKNIGSSTKRNSNDYIGSFGIGRFSCLACKDNVAITSFYENKKYNYLMYKNGSKINIDRTNVVEGSFKNGLEVTIENYKVEVETLEKAINELQLFENLYIEYNGEVINKETINKFNNRKIEQGLHYTIIQGGTGYYIKMGRILYPIDRSKVKTFKGIFITLNIPMGEIDITPNRESVQYTDKTINTINKVYYSARKELSEAVGNAIEDCDDIYQYYTGVVANSYFKAKINDKIIEVFKEDVDITKEIKINGESVPCNFNKFLKEVSRTRVSRDSFFKSLRFERSRGDILLRGLLEGEWFLALKLDDRTKDGAIKYFLYNNKGKYRMVSTIQLIYLKTRCKLNTVEGVDQDKCCEFLFDRLTIHEISNSATPLNWLTPVKTKKEVVTDGNNDNIRLYHKYQYTNGSFKDDIEPKRKDKGFFILSTHTKDDHSLLMNIVKLGHPHILAVFTCKKELYESLKGSKKFVTLEEFMSYRHPFWVKLFESLIIRYKFYKIKDCSNFKQYTDFYEEYKEYINCYDLRNFDNLREVYEDNNWLRDYKLNGFDVPKEDIEAYRMYTKAKKYSWAIARALVLKRIGPHPNINLDVSVKYNDNNKGVLATPNRSINQIFNSYDNDDE